jgi:hypothetical protein
MGKDRMWHILGKVQEPVRIADVMRKYRTIQRIIHELDGKFLNNHHTILEVTMFFMCPGDPKAQQDDSPRVFDAEPHIRHNANREILN